MWSGRSRAQPGIDSRVGSRPAHDQSPKDRHTYRRRAPRAGHLGVGGVLTATVGDTHCVRSGRHPDPERDAVNAIGRLAWYCGCLTMPALALRISAVTLSDLCFGAAAFAASLSMARHRPDRPRALWTIAAAMAVVAAALAHPVVGQEEESLAVAFRLVLIWTVWRWVGVSLLGRTEHVVRSLVWFLVGSAISALVATCQVGLGIAVLGSTAVGVDARAAGLTEHVNQQGGQSAVAFGVAMALLAHYGARTALVLFAAAVAVGLVLSGSVTGMIAAAAATLYLFARMEGIGRRIKVGATLVVGAYLALWVQQQWGGANPWERYDSATGSGGGTNTLRAATRGPCATPFTASRMTPGTESASTRCLAGPWVGPL